MTKFRLFKLKVLADDSFEFDENGRKFSRQVENALGMGEIARNVHRLTTFELDENGRKFSKWVENTVGKGEVALFKLYLFFPQCFQKTCPAGTYKPGLTG